MIEAQEQKLEILLEQERWNEAETIVKELLSQDPENVYYLYVLSRIFIAKKQFSDALQTVEMAIGLEPDWDQLIYLQGICLYNLDKTKLALEALNHGLELNPQNNAIFGYIAYINFNEKNFEKALDYANKALEIEPEDVFALNTRSSALVKLDRQEEAFETIEGALNHDPNNDYTHANYGWGLLEKNDHKKALEHFKEALSHQPNNAYAQAGMLEAIKATNPIYRMFLKYNFWITKQTAKYQWAFLILFVFGTRIVRNVADTNQVLGNILYPIYYILIAFAVSTWLVNPISNLFLRFNTYGKLLLDKKEKLSSTLVAVALGVSILSLVLFFILNHFVFIYFVLFGVTIAIPLSSMFTDTKPKNILVYYTIGLAVLGIHVLINLSFYNILPAVAPIYLFGFIAYQWIANYFIIKN